MVTTPRHVPQPPLVGPLLVSSAIFHSTTPLAQLRLPLITRVSNTARKPFASPPCHEPPEASVMKASLFEYSLWRVVCPFPSPPYHSQAIPETYWPPPRS